MGKFISQCTYCGEFFEKMVEICPFCGSEGLIATDPKEKVEWGGSKKPT